jgi:hypothetical protein
MVAHGASRGMDGEEKQAAERRKIAGKPTILSPVPGAWPFPNTFPTARAVGYRLPLLRSYFLINRHHLRGSRI